MWRKLDLPLTVKFHHIEDHVVPMMKRYRCLGDYAEESIERLHRIINLKRHQYATTRSWERRHSKILDEHRMGAYPGVENSREASKSYRKRVYSDATQQIKREAARALDETIAEKKRRAVVGVGTGTE